MEKKIRIKSGHEIICRILEKHVRYVDKDLLELAEEKKVKLNPQEVQGYVRLEQIEEKLSELHGCFIKYLVNERKDTAGLKDAFCGYLCDDSISELINERMNYQGRTITWKEQTRHSPYDVPEMIKKPLNEALKAYYKMLEQARRAKQIQQQSQQVEYVKKPQPDKTSLDIKKVSFKDNIWYKGYTGLWDTYCAAKAERDGTPIEKNVIGFIKGSLDFKTLRQINNLYREAQNKKTAPNYPFICIEESVYEFTPEYASKTETERSLLLMAAKAIITQQVLKITYAKLGNPDGDVLEFHPQYIRRVGRKLMLFGESKSIRYGEKYTLVNLIFSRIKEMQWMTEADYALTNTPSDKSYRRAKVDYNKDYFAGQMTFNAHDLMAVVEPVRVVLRLKQVYEMTFDNVVYPFKRILQEPLHHSQRQVYRHLAADGSIYYDTTAPGVDDDIYGYVQLHITDSMYIKPILLQWGSQMEVMEPEKLRQKIYEEVERMAQMYGMRIRGEERQEMSNF